MKRREKVNPEKSLAAQLPLYKIKYTVKTTLRLTDEDANRCKKVYANYNNPADQTEAGFLRYLIRLGLKAAEQKTGRN